jgi:hypothetical protein
VIEGRVRIRRVTGVAVLLLAVLVATYGVIATDAIGAIARWGRDLRPVEALPARVVIDGFPVGAPVVCEPLRCQTWTAIGETALDQREPRHPKVLESHVHTEDLANQFVVAPAASTRSLTYVIVVFDLEDGTHRAVGVVCAPNECQSRPRYDR